ncbi:MAG: branched-chain amino acid ABC transporter permease, partial [Pseudomonadota bacterium]|nr:branched-chain amino acid ABC transporter permease [Pseudomonadota bacterium]
YVINLGSQVLIAALFALSLNLLVGYAGLTSLGHAGYLGLAGYLSGWLVLNMQWGHLASGLAALAITTVMAALFGLVALRATGLSFLMITLAFGQILWGIAYRWASVTGGDNGLSGLTRPAPFGLDLGQASAFYYFTLAVFVLVWGLIALWVRSPFGASICGTRDQPRRMSALGYNVWLIRWITFIVSGFFGAVAGLMYVYYHQFISPHSLSLANSAEMLLMVIAGGPGTLVGPVVGAALVVLLKNVASAYIDRWIMLLGFVFIFIVMFVPGGIVPGVRRALLHLRPRLRRPPSESDKADPVIASSAHPLKEAR